MVLMVADVICPVGAMACVSRLGSAVRRVSVAVRWGNPVSGSAAAYQPGTEGVAAGMSVDVMKVLGMLVSGSAGVESRTA